MYKNIYCWKRQEAFFQQKIHYMLKITVKRHVLSVLSLI